MGQIGELSNFMQAKDQDIVSIQVAIVENLSLICPTYFQYSFENFSKARESNILRFEEKLGEALPDDYRTFLLNLDRRLCLGARPKTLPSPDSSTHRISNCCLSVV